MDDEIESMDKSPDSNVEELILRSFQGRLSRFEQERLRAWRASSEENEKTYQELREVWSVTGTASPSLDVAPPDFDSLMEAAEAAEEKKASGSARSAPESAPKGVVPRERSGMGTRAGPRWLRRAAVGLMAAGLVGLGLGIGVLAGGDEQGVFANGEIVTGAGEMTTVTLADGSSIRLGPESRLRLDQERDRRMAWLEGRAFFGVESDADRPFTVFTDQGEAVVLGTRFEVRTEEDEFRVLVVEGEVSVAADSSEVRITEGEMSRRTVGSGLSTERVDDVYQQLGWLGNATVFQATTLDRAIRELERRYGLEFTVADSSLLDMSVTAAFTGQPVEDVVVVICEIVGARCEMEENRVRMER